MKEFSSYYYSKTNDQVADKYKDIGYFEPYAEQNHTTQITINKQHTISVKVKDHE